jgi:hypothetical protein
VPVGVLLWQVFGCGCWVLGVISSEILVCDVW